MASAGLLKKVQYPSGMYNEFDYEACNAGVRLLRLSSYDTPSNKIIKKYLYQENATHNVLPIHPVEKLHTQLWTTQTCEKVSEGGGPRVYSGWKLIKDESKIQCHLLSYSSTYPFSFSDLSGISPKNYTLVTELNGENGENGKTDYYFPLMQYEPYGLLPMDKNPKEGLMNKKIVYKYQAGAFSKVSETIYDHDFGTGTYTNTTSNGFKTYLWYQPVNNTLVGTYLGGYLMKISQLKKLTYTSILYDQNDPNKSSSSTTVEKYDPYGDLKEMYTNNNAPVGLGRYSRIYRYYERSSNAPTLLKHLPVENISFSYTGDIDVSPSKKAHSNSFIEYSSTGLALHTWVSNASVSTATGLVPISTSYRKIASNLYEPTNQNMVQQNTMLQENAAVGYNNTFSKTSVIWGYRNTLPIAVVSNADKSQIGYNGFENGVLAAHGGWDAGTATNTLLDKTVAGTDLSNVFNGRFTLKLASATATPSYSPTYITKPIPQTGKYKLSCWVKLSSGTIYNNVSLYVRTFNSTTASPYLIFPNSTSYVTKTVTNKSDWQYVEAIIDFDNIKLAAPSTDLSLLCYVVNTSTTGFAYVDDIRLHPVDAQMSTYTYKPGIGKTSDSGPNSKPTHYEYDVFGRLLYVRDFRRNILKKNQYKFKQ
jgi:hypothetical protein